MKRFAFLVAALTASAAMLAVSGFAASATSKSAPPRPGVHYGPVYVSMSDVSADEGTTAAMTIRLSWVMPIPIDIYWQTSAATAAAPNDYTKANGEVTFLPGEKVKTCLVTSRLNGIHGDQLSFKVHLWADNPLVIVTRDGTYTIHDMDPVPTVHISDAPSITEGGTLVYTLTLSNKTVSPVTVDLGLWYSATYDGYLLRSSDIVGAMPSSVQFAPLTTSQTYTIQTTANALDDSNPGYTDSGNKWVRAWMHMTGATNALLPNDWSGNDDDLTDCWALGLVYDEHNT